MPQMNPMNWLFLFLFFNIVGVSAAVKINYLVYMKEGVSSSNKCESVISEFNMKF